MSTAERIADLEALRAAVRRGYRPTYLMFWGHRARPGKAVGQECLSQWWPATFVIDGDAYATAEHFMMAGKARLFRDDDALAKILKASSPAAAKRLGRQVRGFDGAVWTKARFELVVRGNVAKFRQNPELAAFLLGTKQRVLVEASPVDRIWGIGMAASAPGADDPAKWRGLNLLGFALMEARRALSGASP